MWKLIKEIKYYELKYENLLIFLISLILAYIILTPAYFQSFEALIGAAGDFGYIGAFVAGSFFTYFITVPISATLIVALGKSLNPLYIALIGALGAAISDFIIFYFFRKKFSSEIKKFESKIKNKKITKFIHHFFPLIGVFIISSPLPDELGVAMVGLSRYEKKKTFLIFYLSNFIGILLLAFLGYSL